MSLLENDAYLAALNSDENNVSIGNRFNISEATVRRHKDKVAKGETVKAAKPVKDDWTVGITFDPITEQPVEIRTPTVDRIVGDDYTAILEAMNVRLPDGYELRLVEVNYNQQAWTRGSVDQEQAVTKPSARYRFKVVAVGVSNVIDFEAASKRAQTWKLPKRIPGTGLGVPVAAVLNLADMQLMKPEGGGVEATLDRLYDGLENFQTYVNRQRASGRNITELAIVNNGDPFEGIAGNYANQLHTVQGGLRAQMNTVLDVWSAYARELFPQFDKGQFVSVHCNHTQFGRQGGAAKSITGDEDTGSAFLAEALQRILKGRPEFDHVSFVIPDDQMNVYTELAGVPVAFNHGHKIPGSDAKGFEAWLNGQVRGDTQAYAARIWFTAHRHHFASWDMGSTFVFQCPSCEGASKWLRDATGKFSRSGILATLVGNHERLGWSDTAFL